MYIYSYDTPFASTKFLVRHVLSMFAQDRYLLHMTDESQLRPATPEEIATALSFALQYRGRKCVHDADDAMGRITAERLVKHLEASGFVVMKKPPVAAPTTMRICRLS